MLHHKLIPALFLPGIPALGHTPAFHGWLLIQAHGEVRADYVAEQVERRVRYPRRISYLQAEPETRRVQYSGQTPALFGASSICI
jgi:hypothetical protein